MSELRRTKPVVTRTCGEGAGGAGCTGGGGTGGVAGTRPSEWAAAQASTRPAAIPLTWTAVDSSAATTWFTVRLGSRDMRRPAIPETAGGPNEDPQAPATPIQGSRNCAQPGALS